MHQKRRMPAPQIYYPATMSGARSLSALESYDRMRLFTAIMKQVTADKDAGNERYLSVPILRPTILNNDALYKEYCSRIIRALYAFAKHRSVTVFMYSVFSIYLHAFSENDTNTDATHPIDVPVKQFFSENAIHQNSLDVQQHIYVRTLVNILAGVAYTTVASIFAHLSADSSYEDDPGLHAICERIRESLDYSDIIRYRARAMGIEGPLLFSPKKTAAVLCTAIPAVITDDLPSVQMSTLFMLPDAANTNADDDES